ncbi:MAG: group 1 glycosyl transferase [Chitinophagaceae bacterium BSSC1]|nr:MAG: group 1 glycosyl transferase [Chitinophagaceae bacterium BSSC1]
MYLEFNLRLFFFLLFQPGDLFCAIDLDTILPVYWASLIRGKIRVYDAHEYFTQQKEVMSRPAIQKVWKAIESFSLRRFPLGYTVNQWIANAFQQEYGVNYAVVRNLPKLTEAAKAASLEPSPKATEMDSEKPSPHAVPRPKLSPSPQAEPQPFFIYQGAVNHGRCFETLIPAMQWVAAPLRIYGTGNFINQSLSIINQYSLNYKIEVFKPLAPQVLQATTPLAYAGITLFEAQGHNQYHSLANRFFDYIMAGIPQLCVDYPEYRAIQDQWEIGLLIPDTQPETIAQGLNKLLEDRVLYHRLKENCLQARRVLNWESEEKVLLAFYDRIFINH